MGIVRHEKEDASAKELEFHITKIALVLSSVRLGVPCLCSQTQVTLQFKSSSACGELVKALAEGQELQRQESCLEKPLGTTAKKTLVKEACISVSVPIMWV